MVAGVVILLTNIFWEIISQQLIHTLWQRKEPAFHAISSATCTQQTLNLQLKEESFVYLLSQEGEKIRLIFPNKEHSFNQFNPHIPYRIGCTHHTPHYLIASRYPLKIEKLPRSLEEIKELKSLGRIDFLQID